MPAGSGATVLAQHNVWARHLVIQPGIDHALRARGEFFGRLERRDQRPVPLLTGRGQLRRRAEQAGDVHVMPARVHHPVDRARIRQTGRLAYRQRVHICAQQHGRPVPAAQHPDHAGRAHALVNLIAVLAQPLCGNPRSAMFLVGQFRVSV